MKTLENVNDKIKEGEKIKNISQEVLSMERDMGKITITSTIKKVRIEIVEDETINYVDIEFYPTELKKLLKEKIEYKKHKLNKLLSLF